MLPKLQSIADRSDRTPTEAEIQSAAELGRRLSEVYGSVSAALLEFGKAMVQGLASGFEKAKLIDWEPVIKKSRKRAKYLRRYERIGAEMRRKGKLR